MNQVTQFDGILILDNINNTASDLTGGATILMTFDPSGIVTSGGVLAAYTFYDNLAHGVSGVLQIHPQGTLENGVLHVVTP